MLIEDLNTFHKNIYTVLRDEQYEEGEQDILYDIQDMVDDALDNEQAEWQLPDDYVDLVAKYNLIEAATDAKADELDDAVALVESEDIEKVRRGLDVLIRIAQQEDNVNAARAIELRTWAEGIEKQRFAELKAAGEEAINRSDIAAIDAAYTNLQLLRPDDPYITELRQARANLQGESVLEGDIALAKDELQQTDNYPELLEGLKLYKRLVGQGVDDPELKALADQAEQARRQITALQGSSATMGAMGQFQTQVNQLRELLDKQVFETPDRDGNIRPTRELLAEAREALQNAQRSTIDSRLEKSEEFLEKQPQRALLILDDLNEFIKEFVGQDEYLEVERYRRLAEENAKQWREADAILREAIRIADPRERLARIHDAQQVYPQHYRMDQRIKEAKHDVRLVIRREVNAFLDQGDSLLNIHHEQIPFQEIESYYEQAENRLTELGTVEGILSEVEGELRQRRKSLTIVGQQHDLIRQVSQELRDALTGTPEVVELDELLAKLPEEHQDHVLLARVRRQIDRLRGDEENYRLAEYHFSLREYDQVIDICNAIRPDGDYSEAAQSLRMQASVKKGIEDVQVQLDQLRYKPAEDIIKRLLPLAQEHATEDIGQLQAFADQINEWRRNASAFEEALAQAQSTYVREPFAGLERFRQLVVEHPDREEAQLRFEEILNEENARQIALIEQFLNASDADKRRRIDAAETAANAMKKYDLLRDGREREQVLQARKEITRWKYHAALQSADFDEALTQIGLIRADAPIEAQTLEKNLMRMESLFKMRQAMKSGDRSAIDAAQTRLDIVVDKHFRSDVEMRLLSVVADLYGARYEEARQKVVVVKNIANADQAQLGILEDIIKRLEEHVTPNEARAGRRQQETEFDSMLSILEGLKEELDELQRVAPAHPETNEFIDQKLNDWTTLNKRLRTKSFSYLDSKWQNGEILESEKIMVLLQMYRIGPDVNLRADQKNYIADNLSKEIERAIEATMRFNLRQLHVEKAHNQSLSIAFNLKNLLSIPELLQRNILDPDQESSLRNAQAAFVQPAENAASLHNLLSDFLEFQKTLPNPPAKNVHVRFEKGQDLEDRVEEIRNDQLLNAYADNPTVEQFIDWYEETIDNRQRALELVEQVKDGLAYNVGPDLPPDADFSEEVARDLDAYQLVIKSIEKIYDLASNRRLRQDIYDMGREVYDRNGRITTLAEHQDLAQKRSENLEAWQNWYLDAEELLNQGIELVNAGEVATPPPLSDMVKHYRDDRALNGISFGSQNTPCVFQAFVNYQEARHRFKETVAILREKKPAYPLSTTAERIELFGEDLLEMVTENHEHAEQEINRLAVELGVTETAYKENSKEYDIENFVRLRTDASKRIGRRRVNLNPIHDLLVHLYRLNSEDDIANRILANYRAKYAQQNSGGK